MKIVRRTKYFFRVKYRKGHNIHSPFVYYLVRSVFMPKPSSEIAVDQELYTYLTDRGIKRQHALRCVQMYAYMEYKTYAVNPEQYNGEDMIFLTSVHSIQSVDRLISQIDPAAKRVTIIVNGINKNNESRKWWDGINLLALDFNYFGVIVIDKFLSPKKYKLKF